MSLLDAAWLGLTFVKGNQCFLSETLTKTAPAFELLQNAIPDLHKIKPWSWVQKKHWPIET